MRLITMIGLLVLLVAPLSATTLQG